MLCKLSAILTQELSLQKIPIKRFRQLWWNSNHFIQSSFLRQKKMQEYSSLKFVVYFESRISKLKNSTYAFESVPPEKALTYSHNCKNWILSFMVDFVSEWKYNSHNMVTTGVIQSLLSMLPGTFLSLREFQGAGSAFLPLNSLALLEKVQDWHSLYIESLRTSGLVLGGAMSTIFTQVTPMGIDLLTNYNYWHCNCLYALPNNPSW